MIVPPKAKLSGEPQALGKAYVLKIDLSSPKTAIFAVDSAKEGWIQSTFADATVFRAELDLACADENNDLPIHQDDQDDRLLRDDIMIDTRSLFKCIN